MDRIKVILSGLLLLLCASYAQAETVTEDFESVSIVDASGNAVSGNYAAGAGLSNGWVVVGGGICVAPDYSNFGLWSTAYSGSKSLTAQYGSTNNAVIVIPVQISGNISFYARKTSSSSSTKGYVDIFEMEESNGTFVKKSSSSFAYWTLTSTTWTKYEYNLGSTAKYIGISLVRAGFDDFTYTAISSDPHEHSYASAWSSDENEHWHACTSETGYCETPKTDVAAHDGLTCSVCGYKTPGVEAYPWTEDFEGITSGIPAGWDNSEGTTTTASYKWNYYNSYSEGKSVRFDSYNNRSGITNVLATPWLYIPETGVYELKFKCKNPKGGNYEVKIAEYGSDERIVLFDNLTNIASWTEKTASLADYAGKAVKIYFCGTSNWGSGDAYLYLDDVMVKESITHNHDYATEWSHDVRNHWHACTSEVGECDAPKADFAAHTFDENDICSVCGYDKPFMEDFEDGIPALWTNNGWTVENNPSYGNGTRMAYAGRFAAGNTLTTPRLSAKTGDVIEVEALLPWNDETLTMEYSTDEGETWSVAFAETPAANNTLCTLSWTAPADGVYLLRFSGRYNYIDNVCGFKLAPTVLEASTLDMTNHWATLCYPAEVALADGVQAFKVTGVEEGYAELTEVESTVPAFEPVLLYSASAVNLPLPEAQYVKKDMNPVEGSAGNYLVGCTNELTLNKNTQYVLQKQDGVVAFYKVSPSKAITTTPYRAYLEAPEEVGSAKLSFFVDGETTAINGISVEDASAVYDLSGRKVEHLQKGGVYVMGNKKVVVR